MKFLIDGLEVIFPYPVVYKQQLQYMQELQNTFDHRGHGILEMPTGTGKTVSLLALITSYLVANPDQFQKLVYCTRTVVEMEKTIKEVKFVLDCRKRENPDQKHNFLVAGLTTRKNLCCHPIVSQLGTREKVDSECRRLTAPWTRMKKGTKDYELEQQENKLGGNNVDECEFYQNFQETEKDLKFETGVFNMDDLRNYGVQNTVCPYFTARQLMAQSNIVVFNYLYMLDDNVTDVIPEEIRKDSIVVFDEAHNIDDICIQTYSIDINKRLLDAANSNIDKLGEQISHTQKENHFRLQKEYNELLEGLQKQGMINANQLNSNQSMVPEDLKQHSVPFHIRQAKPFINFVRQIVTFLQNQLKEKSAMTQDPPAFLNDMSISMHLDAPSLRMVSQRLHVLFNTLEISESDEYIALNRIAMFSSLISSHTKGFKIIFQPSPVDGSLNDPLLTFSCLDSSLAIQPVFKQYASVILTSGTMSPLDIYPKILNFAPYMLKSIDIQLTRNSISPLIITKGLDHSPMSSEFQARNNKDITLGYGEMLIELAQIVPDGIVCFFPSYRYMERIIREWDEYKILDKIREFKLLYFESQDVQQTSLVLKDQKNQNDIFKNIFSFFRKCLSYYRKACDCGRGAIFLSIARGKIAEGIDFDDHYGRCVVMLGFPVQNSKDPILLVKEKSRKDINFLLFAFQIWKLDRFQERIAYLTENFKVQKDQFIEFDAMRQSAQCLGRVMRGKMDYGLMIMAEKRFGRSQVRNKLPQWIKQCMNDTHIDISIEMGLIVAKEFFKLMGQPFILDSRTFTTQKQFEENEKLHRKEVEQANQIEAEKEIKVAENKIIETI